MKCLLFTHKNFQWVASEQTYITDGGFPRQVEAIAHLFETVYIVFPQFASPQLLTQGVAIQAPNVRFVPLQWRGGISWRSIVKNHLRLLLSYFKLFRQVDIIHCPLPSYVGVAPAILALLLRKRLWVRYCGNIQHPSTPIQHLLIRLMRATAHYSHVSYLATGLGERPFHPHIPWIFATSLSEKEIRALQRCVDWKTTDPPIILWVGRLEPGKGVQQLIEIIQSAQCMKLPFQWHVVGDGRLRNLIQGLKWQDPNNQIKWDAYLPHPQLMKVFCRSSLLLFTSQGEGFPKVVHEAMAAGLPILAHPVGPLPELVRQGASIFWMDEHPESVVTQIQKVLDSPDYSKYGLVNQRIARNFSLERWREVMKTSLRKFT